jgi:hypothetical protein
VEAPNASNGKVEMAWTASPETDHLTAVNFW